MATEKSSIAPVPGGQIMSSSSSLDDLDDALLLEILVRGLLNTKVAFQCKSVCKRWQNLISSPIFGCLWKELHHGEPLPLILVLNLRFRPDRRFRPDEDKYMISCIVSKPRVFPFLGFKLDFLPCSKPGMATSVRIAASCKDVLLCNSIGHNMDLEPRVYYICNPVTKHWIAIPPFPSKYPFMECTVGMVYGEKSFQVVRIHRIYDERSSKYLIAEVFSSETNIWEEMEITDPSNSISGEMFICISRLDSYKSDNMFSWNGILFMEERGSNSSIIAYNPLEPKRCHILNNPTDQQEIYVYSMAFGDCHGSLRLLQLCYMDGHRITSYGCFRIWELKDYKEGEWSLKKKVLFRELITEKADLLREPSLKVLALDSNDKDTIYFYHEVGGTLRRIFSCNLRTKEVNMFDSTIQELTADGNDCSIGNVFQFAVPKWPTPVPMLP